MHQRPDALIGTSSPDSNLSRQRQQPLGDGVPGRRCAEWYKQHLNRHYDATTNQIGRVWSPARPPVVDDPDQDDEIGGDARPDGDRDGWRRRIHSREREHGWRREEQSEDSPHGCLQQPGRGHQHQPLVCLRATDVRDGRDEKAGEGRNPEEWNDRERYRALTISQ